MREAIHGLRQPVAAQEESPFGGAEWHEETILQGEARKNYFLIKNCMSSIKK
jgi:hypothetical protein